MEVQSKLEADQDGGMTYLVSSGLPVVPKALGLKETRMFEEPARAGATGASAA